MEKVKIFIVLNNKLPSTHSKDKEEKRLGQWIATQNKRCKQGKGVVGNETYRREFENLKLTYPYLFFTDDELWTFTMNEVKNFKNKYNKLPSSTSNDQKEKQLGKWICHQNDNYKNKKHSMKSEEKRIEWENFRNS